MKHLFAAWPRVIRSLKKLRVLLFLDFDGTLAPIVERPPEAALPAGTRSVLKKLRARDWCTVAVISGRTLPNLVRKVRIEGIIYGGCHGAQLKGPNIEFQAPLSAETYHAFQMIKSDLKSQAAAMKGVVMEDKTHCLSIHFREAAEADISELKGAMSRIVRPFIDDGYVRISAGKKVFDVVPRSWNKGKAVQWLVSRLSSPEILQSAVPMYIGDDATDEDAFAAIGENGISVLVGNNVRSAAQYCLKDPGEVLRFLKKLLLLNDQ